MLQYLKKLFGFDTKSPNAKTYVVPPREGSRIPDGVAATCSLRRRNTPHTQQEQYPRPGMWVTTTDGSVGILLRVREGDEVDVVLVDPVEGKNVEVKTYYGANLHQAYYEEIPVERRPDYKRAESFGYISRDTTSS